MPSFGRLVAACALLLCVCYVGAEYNYNLAHPYGTLEHPSVPARLVFEDGSEFKGRSFGFERPVSGEVVFNTAMTGYVETLTDASYRGQILVATYPLIGNYGVPGPDEDENGLPKFYESDRIHVAGLIVSDYSHLPSHWQNNKTLSAWLAENHVPALWGLDTRAITKKLRSHGSLKGKIVFENRDIAFDDIYSRNLVAEVSVGVFKVYGQPGLPRVIVVDCGVKYNIIRKLLDMGVQVKLVPWNHSFDSETEPYHGILVSNGPGDPALATATIENLKRAMTTPPKGASAVVPIFGICLGNQLLALAAGASTYKLKFGNRGHNQPVRNLLNHKLWLSSQNHGFAVDEAKLPEGWVPFFKNINDETNEGIVHKTKPFFSAQFHPEHSGGPVDAEPMFDMFLSRVNEYFVNGTASSVYTAPEEPPKRDPLPKKVIILGSGGLSIGQAGEFDYSGAQAIKALKAEGIKTVLVNPNIASVQTQKTLADAVYFLPITPEFIEKIIEQEEPDGILLSFGGQTGLNCGIQLEQSGILAKHGVRVLGTPVESIILTEDRDLFKQHIELAGYKCAPSIAVNSTQAAILASGQIGFPIIVRAAFALGGLGSGFADNIDQLTELVDRALASSPQVLVEKSVKGWKELEYEVVRDAFDNCLTPCNLENFDPVGVHTGESIVVAPSQTLSNKEYHMLRKASIDIIRHFGIIGECNIQYALNPESLEFFVIEVNPRLSRSSALASKATGYPLAFVAAKLQLGMELGDVVNGVTKTTSAFFEPSLDYVVVKIPRWDFTKFASIKKRTIGSAMQSIGEVMGIGRSFPEALQKAIRMTEGAIGFEPPSEDAALYPKGKLWDALKRPTDRRLYAVAEALYLQSEEFSVDAIYKNTGIDPWFLHQLNHIVKTATGITGALVHDLSREQFLLCKQAGFSDKQISIRVGATEKAVRAARQALNVIPVVKQIDTMAAEVPAATNYLYTTYNAEENDVSFDLDGVLVLGSGVYRIGSSVEFDSCTVSCLRRLRELGTPTIALNSNPETVSTDYDESDRLYFDEMTFERVLDIYELENSRGVVVSMGGQTPNNLALPLHRADVKILGTSPESIDNAEDRNRFSSLLDSIDVKQPKWSVLSTFDEATAFVEEVGLPVLVRPSYVLSGAAMKVVHSSDVLSSYLNQATALSPDHPVVISKFVEGAKEIDVDAVAANGELVIFAISGHVENAGVHSGDATLVLPADFIPDDVKLRLKAIVQKIGKALNISGPFNTQFLYKDDELLVIETNLRASRSMPFVSKVLDVDFLALATDIMLHRPVEYNPISDNLESLGRVGVKVSQFSYKRLLEVDPVLSVEMASTGEVASFGVDKYAAFINALMGATPFKLPPPGSKILFSVPVNGGDEVSEIIDCVQAWYRLGFVPTGDNHLVAVVQPHGVPVEELVTVDESTGSNRAPLDAIAAKEVSLVVDFAGVNGGTLAAAIRRAAVDFTVPLITDLRVATMLATALARYPEPANLPVLSHKEYLGQ